MAEPVHSKYTETHIACLSLETVVALSAVDQHLAGDDTHGDTCGQDIEKSGPVKKDTVERTGWEHSNSTGAKHHLLSGS